METTTTPQKTVDYGSALRQYGRYGAHRSMKKFCEDEGYDYNKFCRYARRGLTNASILIETSPENATSEKPQFISLEAPEMEPKLSTEKETVIEIRVRFSNGMELVRYDGRINEMVTFVQKFLG